MLNRPNSYPGEVASPAQIKALADEYKGAAESLALRGVRGKPTSWAPARLTAIHAIELYLNAFLLIRGFRPSTIRRLQHDLKERALHAEECGLKLRKKTKVHLTSLSENREYLSTRYAADFTGDWAQLNWLMAALDEISEKVAAVLP